MTEQITEQQPPMWHQGQAWSVESAKAKLAALDKDKDFVAAALGGDVAKQQERAAYLMLSKGQQPGALPATPQDEGAVAQTMQERDQQIHEAKLDTFAKHVRMSPQMRVEYSRRLATQDQHDYAVNERARLLKDGAFRAKVLANDADAVHRWITIVQVASAPVAAADYDWNANANS